jgi:hypothetical protein
MDVELKQELADQRARVLVRRAPFTLVCGGFVLGCAVANVLYILFGTEALDKALLGGVLFIGVSVLIVFRGFNMLNAVKDVRFG